MLGAVGAPPVGNSRSKARLGLVSYGSHAPSGAVAKPTGPLPKRPPPPSSSDGIMPGVLTLRAMC
jgi:hypothetical protein